MISRSRRRKSEWWETIFDEKYLKTYVDSGTPEVTAKEVSFLVKRLQLARGANLLDLACGYGRHAIALARHGFRVTGIDLSKHFIALARNEAAREGLEISFEVGDMRNLSFDKEFDAVINLFSSFGYFEDASDDSLVLRKVCRALKPKGKFLFDLNNTWASFARVLRQGNSDNKTGLLTAVIKTKLSNGLILTEKDEFVPETVQWITTKTWMEKGRRRRYQFRVRVFVVPQLRLLLEQNGLFIKRLWGGFEGSPYSFDSRRIVILAAKA